MSKKVWVSRDTENNGWRVHSTESKKDLVHSSTQKIAIEKAREIAKRHSCEIIISGKDGKIRSSDSYGRDPFPPKHQEKH